LVAAGCQHIAAIEISLRPTDEATLGELDVTTIPLDEIAESLPAAAERWVSTAEGGTGLDEVTESVSRLEHAAQDVAWQRLSQAIMRLDEETRMRVLASALRADGTGRRMDGMLSVFAKMRPASLARLLKLTAERSATDPERIASVMALPPETVDALALLLAPSPTAHDSMVDTDPPADIAAEVSERDDPEALRQMCEEAARALASGRALATAVAVSRTHQDTDSVRAIGDALPAAACDGAFENVREALRRLDELADRPFLADAVDSVRAELQRPDVLRSVCAAPKTDADAAIAGEILLSAGTAGAEALLDTFLRAKQPTRSLLRPTLRAMSESIVGIASRRLRGSDVDSAVAIVRILPHLGDSRVVPTMQQALEHLDVKVRRAAITALADTQGDDARGALVKAVNHWDPTTQRFAVREIGRVRAVEAIPTMVRTLDDINPFERSHELKKEIIVALEATRSPEALPVLRRVAGRRLAVGRKNKELRLLAQRATESLERRSAQSDQGVDLT
ncbi:MAG: HEAT repeat domain-containing protein, partial [Coriobacteriales bacterium]|nr:HEAT repeat domain-containing protein [Coriobacteriales bacterium]